MYTRHNHHPRVTPHLLVILNHADQHVHQSPCMAQTNQPVGVRVQGWMQHGPIRMHVRVDPRPSPGMQHAVRVIILVLHHDTKKTKELVYKSRPRLFHGRPG